MAGMAGGRRLPATHYRKSADKAVGADKTLRCVYFLKFLYLLLFCLFFKVFLYLSPLIFVYQQTRQSGPGSCRIPGYPGIPGFFQNPNPGILKNLIPGFQPLSLTISTCFETFDRCRRVKNHFLKPLIFQQPIFNLDLYSVV